MLLCVFYSSIPGWTQTAVIFEAQPSFDFDGDSIAFALDDFNGDGIPDAAVAEHQTRAVSILLGKIDGSFRYAGKADPTGLLRTSIASSDFDGDGDRDLVTTSIDWDDYYYGFLGGRIEFIPGEGNGTFGEDVVVLEGDFYPAAACTADFDGDGHPDLAVTDTVDETVLVLLGVGDGTFGQPQVYQTGLEPVAVISGDFDLDGDVDLATADAESDRITGLLNDGSGNFEAGPILFVAGEPRALISPDMNQDGIPDLVVACTMAETIEVHIGQGDGTFFRTFSTAAGGGPTTISALDFNGDSHPDLAVGFDSPAVAFFAGDGTGDLSPVAVYATPRPAAGVAALDLDRDDDDDLCLLADGQRFIISDDPHFWIVGHYGRLTVMLNEGNAVFPMPQSLPMGEGPRSLALGDLNGDAFSDLVSVDGENLIVRLGNGDGTFGDEMNCGGEDLRSLALGDLNLDGRLDAVAGAVGVCWIFLGNGDGSFTTAGSLDLWSLAIELFDLNLDGIPDLIVSHSGGVEVLLGGGDGTFPPTQSIYGGFDFSAAAGDLDGDGLPDLATRWYSGDTFPASYIEVWLGLGDGTFNQSEQFRISDYHGPICLADLDLDGDLDAALPGKLTRHYGNGSGDKIRLYHGNGDGTFTSGPRYQTGIRPSAVISADLTGDGYPDIITANNLSRGVSVLTADRAGGLIDGVTLMCGEEPTCLASGDLDGDGDQDLVAGNQESGDITIFLNQSNCRFLATGPGRGSTNPPLVRLFDLERNGEIRSQWLAYGAPRYGVNVALGELDGATGAGTDPEILTGPGPGDLFGPQVRGFERDGSPLAGLSFLAYGTNRYGVNVAAGDLDADGFDEIVTGAGPGAVYGPHVRGWNWDDSGTLQPIPGISYFAYGTLKWGVNVACGDVDGDGIDEIVTGAGPGAVFGPHVRGWNWDGTGAAESIPGVNFIAYDSARWGVNVSCGDLDGDGIDEILTGCGPGPDQHARVRGWNCDGEEVAPMENVDFTAYDPDEILHGVKVAGHRRQ